MANLLAQAAHTSTVWGLAFDPQGESREPPVCCNMAFFFSIVCPRSQSNARGSTANARAPYPRPSR